MALSVQTHSAMQPPMVFLQIIVGRILFLYVPVGEITKNNKVSYLIFFFARKREPLHLVNYAIYEVFLDNELQMSYTFKH